jgi:hypothetical protein
MQFEVTYDDGAQLSVDIPSLHPGADYVLSAVEDAHHKSADRALSIVRHGPAGKSVIWRRPVNPRGIAQQSIRLFASFAYEIEEAEPTPMRRTVYGNTLLDIEFEPSESAHVAGLEAQLAHYISEQGIELRSGTVTLMHWQRVQK